MRAPKVHLVPLATLALVVAATPARAVTPFATRVAFDAALAADRLATTGGEDWDLFSVGTTFTDGSTSNGIGYSTSSGVEAAVVQGTFIHSSHPNGLGQTGLDYFPAGDTVTLSFSQPITAFGIDISTFATAAGAYTATTDQGQVIESQPDPFPGFGTGQFVGFVADAGEGPFDSVTIASTGSAYVLDGLRYATAVPLPPFDRPAFPGAFGYGATTHGALACGTTPAVLTVDTLADDETDGCGAGSCTFREAITHPGPAFINFNVAGTIVIDGWLRIQGSASCKTVSGATAPGEGVTIANETLEFSNGFHDLIMRHVRIRPGNWPALRGVAICNAWEYRCDADPDQDCNTVPCLCSPHERGEWQSGCGKCSLWSSSDPDDFSQCNDQQLNAGGVLDAITILDDVSDVIFDHMSLTWAMDETIGVGSVRNASRISVLNSIIGWGQRGIDPEIPAATRNKNTNLGILFGGYFGTPNDAKTVTQWTFGRNFIGGNHKRVPKHNVGYGVEYVNNIFFNNEKVGNLSPYKSSVPLHPDFRFNVFRAGPDDLIGRSTQGYCESGPDLGRACGHNNDCQGGANLCDKPFPYFFAVESNDSSRGRLFLEGNLFLDDAGAPYARPYTELDDQWDFVDQGVPSGQGWLRPRRIEDANQTTWWDHRRSAAFEPRPWADAVPIDPSALAAALLSQVGASLPVLDAVDAALVATWTTPVSWPGPDFVYPDPTATPWGDGDADGLADVWELAHFGDLAQGPLDDAEGDAYLNIEEWMNGTDPNQATWSYLLPLFGAQALGGQLSVTVAGVQVTVATASGQSPTAVLASLAAALEADPGLAALGGVTAVATRNLLILDRVVDAVSIEDAGLRTSFDLPPQSALKKLPAAGAAGLGCLAFAMAAGGTLAVQRVRRP